MFHTAQCYTKKLLISKPTHSLHTQVRFPMSPHTLRSSTRHALEAMKTRQVKQHTAFSLQSSFNTHSTQVTHVQIKLLFFLKALIMGTDVGLIGEKKKKDITLS